MDTTTSYNHPTDHSERSMRDSAWAAVGAAATIVVLLFTAASVAFGTSANPI